MSADLVALLYLVAGVLFILALRGLASPETSRRGNLFGMVGMAIAILTTLASHPPPGAAGWALVVIGIAVGGGTGVVIARRVPMTAMPELVAAFHSLVGMAAVLVAAGALYAPAAFDIGGVGTIHKPNLVEMSRLPTPIICVVIGEGGSGGALGIGVGDRVSMLEHAYYSVISPEGCAGILWKEANDKTKPLAAEALKLTARDLFRLRVIDDIIPEPLGGAHRDHREMANILKAYLLRYLRDLRNVPTEELLEGRYQKFRKMGVFDEGISEVAAAGNQ